MSRFKVDPTRRTSATVGVELHRLAIASGRGGMWVSEAREWAAAEGLTAKQLAEALRYSGLYPLRLTLSYPRGTTWWAVDKPRWWVLDRVPGKRPEPQRKRCYSCGQKYVIPVPPPVP